MWTKGISGNPRGGNLPRPKRGTALARAIVKLENVKLERLSIDTSRDSPLVAQAKQLHLQAAKGDKRAIAMIQEYSASVMANDNNADMQINIPGREGGDDLCSMIAQLYGVAIRTGRAGDPVYHPDGRVTSEKPLLPEKSAS